MLRRVRQKWRHGLLLRSGMNRLARWGLDIRLFYVYCEAPPARGAADDRLAPPLEMALLGPGDMRRCASARADESELRRWLEQGRLCFGVKDSTAVLSWMWCDLHEFDPLAYTPYGRPLTADEAFLFGAYTRPEARGQGLAGRLRQFAIERLRAMGRDKLYSCSAYFNRAANRFKRRQDARPLTLCLYVILLGRVRWSRTLRRYEGADDRSGAARRLAVPAGVAS